MGYEKFENTVNKKEFQEIIQAIKNENPFGINAIINECYIKRRLTKYTDKHYLAINVDNPDDMRFIDEETCMNYWKDYVKREILNRINIGKNFWNQQNCKLLNRHFQRNEIGFHVVDEMHSQHTGIFDTHWVEKELSCWNRCIDNAGYQETVIEFSTFGGGGFFELTDEGDYLIRLYNFDPNKYVRINLSLEEKLEQSLTMLLTKLKDLTGDNTIYRNKNNFFYANKVLSIRDYNFDKHNKYQINIITGTLRNDEKKYSIGSRTKDAITNPKKKELSSFEEIQAIITKNFSAGGKLLIDRHLDIDSKVLTYNQQ